MPQDTYSKTLQDNLRRIRRSKGLTTTDVAKILGVSQAKVSYIETGRGILSARDVAILARRLDVPVTEFFHGLDRAEELSPQASLAQHLAFFGARLLSKPTGIVLQPVPFEEVIVGALSYVDDDRLFKATCAAFIHQAATRELNSDRIFALAGSNPFLVVQLRKVAEVCNKIIAHLNKDRKVVSPRAKRQIDGILAVANTFVHHPALGREKEGEIADLADFVEGSIHAKG